MQLNQNKREESCPFPHLVEIVALINISDSVLWPCDDMLSFQAQQEKGERNRSTDDCTLFSRCFANIKHCWATPAYKGHCLFQVSKYLYVIWFIHELADSADHELFPHRNTWEDTEQVEPLIFSLSEVDALWSCSLACFYRAFLLLSLSPCQSHLITKLTQYINEAQYNKICVTVK